MTSNQSTYPLRRAPNLFWPIILIGAGIIWLLSNLGMLTVNPWTLLWRLWPVLLIVAGLDILLGRSGIWGTLVSTVLGLVVIAGVIALLLVAQNNPTWLNTPAFNLVSPSAALQTQRLADPLGGTQYANVTIAFPGGQSSLTSLGDSANLLEGDITFYGNLTHHVSKNNNSAQVELRSSFSGFGPFWFDQSNAKWNLGLNPGVIYDLNLIGGSGTYDLDLAQFKIQTLTLRTGSGDARLHLPKSGSYRMDINAGSGTVTIMVPEGLPVRVSANVGSGNLSAPNLRSVSGRQHSGTYESAGFSQTGDYALIDLNLGSGSVQIQ